MWALVEGLLEQDSFKGNSQVMNSFNCIRNYFNLSLKIRILDFIYPPASMTRSSEQQRANAGVETETLETFVNHCRDYKLVSADYGNQCG